MPGRLDSSWRVLVSIENTERDRCVDVFGRPSGTFGFAEFRLDPEDLGVWTIVADFSLLEYATMDDARRAATRAVSWLDGR